MANPGVLRPTAQRWPEESDLVAAWAAGDPAARAAAYERYWPQLVTCLRAGADCDADAEDLAGQAWERIERGLSGFDPTRPLGPWMRAVARRVAASHYRRLRTRDGWRRTVADLAAVAGHAPAVADHAEAVVVRDAVDRALAALPARQRAALLADANGLTDREAAARLGITPNAFRQLLFRGRGRVRQAARREGLAGLFPLPWLRRLGHNLLGRVGETMTPALAAAAAGVSLALLVALPFATVPGAGASRTPPDPAAAPRAAPVEAVVSHPAPAGWESRRTPDDAAVASTVMPTHAEQEGQRPAVAPLAAFAVPGTQIRGHQEPVDNPAYRIEVTVPVPGESQTIGVEADEDARTSEALAAACSAAAAGSPVTSCDP